MMAFRIVGQLAGGTECQLPLPVYVRLPSSTARIYSMPPGRHSGPPIRTTILHDWRGNSASLRMAAGFRPFLHRRAGCRGQSVLASFLEFQVGGPWHSRGVYLPPFLTLSEQDVEAARWQPVFVSCRPREGHRRTDRPRCRPSGSRRCLRCWFDFQSGSGSLRGRRRSPTHRAPGETVDQARIGVPVEPNVPESARYQQDGLDTNRTRSVQSMRRSAGLSAQEALSSNSSRRPALRRLGLAAEGRLK